MASPILHIKDSYYFEVPKQLWQYHNESLEDFADNASLRWWVRLDPDYQLWEAERQYEALTSAWQEAGASEPLPAFESLREEYVHWKHADHANFGRPFDLFLEEQAWFQEELRNDAEFAQNWENIKQQAEDIDAYAETHQWSPEKIESYNHALSGKIIIPQPFAELRNLYEVESGFGISRFMILEVVVALLISAAFIWLARRMRTSDAPRGRAWNTLEAVLLFLRDQVARPAIGHHDADRFVPLLWTIFLFILGCNLLGLVPWAGSPTGAFAVTLALAAVIFGTVLISGMIKFGPLGYWLNQVPSMDLPVYMAVLIKPAVWLIEVAGMIIRHGVLAIRLLANMVAGHLVLLAIMGLAWGVHSAWGWQWGTTATISIVGATLISCLELFVAFLQAYIFTFLSALFIGAAVHHH